MQQLVECVPNFSEGRDLGIIRQITDRIESVENVKLLHVDPGKATHRTVVTFVGSPEDVVEAAFRGIQAASQLIDMRRHKGEHPRFGATDVCPLVPISGIDMDALVQWAHRLGQRVGEELGIPVYFYEFAATRPEWKNLAVVRSGEYEGLEERLKDATWKPDCGPQQFNPQSGAIAISARNFLVAYNVNLNTASTRWANAVAFDVREQGRIKRKGNPVTGEIVKDSAGQPVRIPGSLKCVKAIGWFIKEYGVAQISMNLTDITVTPIHIAFDEVVQKAMDRGLRVTGSELVGLVPKAAILDAGRYYLTKQKRSLGVPEPELIKIAVKSMGLDELGPFDPQKRIIEYRLQDQDASPLPQLSLQEFADETSSESPAPGGGSIAAYAGALGAALGTMVANQSGNKRGWDDRWETFSEWAQRGQLLKDRLVACVDLDTQAFNSILAANSLPKGSEEEINSRNQAVEEATRQAIEIPFEVMTLSLESMEILQEMAQIGNPNSISDAGVGALCARSAVIGSFLNVRINAVDLKDQEFASEKIKAGEEMVKEAQHAEDRILKMVNKKISEK